MEKTILSKKDLNVLTDIESEIKSICTNLDIATHANITSIQIQALIKTSQIVLDNMQFRLTQLLDNADDNND